MHLQWLYKLVYTWLYNLLVHGCVGLAVGPVVERLMDLGTNHRYWSPTVCCSNLLAVLFILSSAIITTLVNLSKFFDLRSGELLPVVKEFKFHIGVRNIGFAIVGSIGVWLAALVLVHPLLTVAFRGKIRVTPKTAFKWCLAGCAGFFFGALPVCNKLIHKVKLALAMKARRDWEPNEYLSMAQSPEFGASEEVELAKCFLRRKINPSSRQYRQEWEQFLKSTSKEREENGNLLSD